MPLGRLAAVVLLTVVLLAHGAEPYLGDAVRAVLASRDVRGQDPNLEVVLVDNGASPESLSTVLDLPRVRVLTPEENIGFAGGCNLGALKARGRYLALVNSDAVVSENALALLVDVAAESGVGIATSSLRLADDPNTINSAGNPLHLTGLVWAGIRPSCLETPRAPPRGLCQRSRPGGTSQPVE